MVVLGPSPRFQFDNKPQRSSPKCLFANTVDSHQILDRGEFRVGPSPLCSGLAPVAQDLQGPFNGRDLGFDKGNRQLNLHGGIRQCIAELVGSRFTPSYDRTALSFLAPNGPSEASKCRDNLPPDACMTDSGAGEGYRVPSTPSANQGKRGEIGAAEQ